MTEALLPDTHIALWLDSGNERLRPSTRGLIDATHDAGIAGFGEAHGSQYGFTTRA